MPEPKQSMSPFFGPRKALYNDAVKSLVRRDTWLAELSAFHILELCMAHAGLKETSSSGLCIPYNSLMEERHRSTAARVRSKSA